MPLVLGMKIVALVSLPGAILCSPPISLLDINNPRVEAVTSIISFSCASLNLLYRNIFFPITPSYKLFPPMPLYLVRVLSNHLKYIYYLFWSNLFKAIYCSISNYTKWSTFVPYAFFSCSK